MVYNSKTFIGILNTDLDSELKLNCKTGFGLIET